MPASKRSRGRTTGGRTTPKGTRPPGTHPPSKHGHDDVDARQVFGGHRPPPGHERAAPAPRLRSGHRG